MVQNVSSSNGERSHKNIRADIIVLGCSLPGIVTAHKLKKKFGNTMNIVVLDLAAKSRSPSQLNVGFQEDNKSDDVELDSPAKQVADNAARRFLVMYAKDFNISLPDDIITPDNDATPLNKLFQYSNGQVVPCVNDFHDFDYLSLLERFELNQYQTVLDQDMRDLFQTNKNDSSAERQKLLYYDKTTMEQHMCDALLFPTSREIMRTMVRLVCGVPANTVSVLFYLHQCHRTNSTKNHLGGDNTRFREKLFGYCRQHLANKLQQSVANITVSEKSIKEIRRNSHEQVILTTIKGERNYICNSLAMALTPDELHHIKVEAQLLTENEAAIVKAMKQGRAKKFVIQYKDSFWRQRGYSGDILSLRGPILWAMERPKLSTAGTSERFPSLIGYLMVRENTGGDSKDAVINQLVILFGEEATEPVSYYETNIADVFVPRCGDYVTLRRLTGKECTTYFELGAMDIFADGDVAAALEAGHAAYLHLLRCLRPQAQTFEDITALAWPTCFPENIFNRWYAQVNIVNTMRLAVYTTAFYIGIRLIQSYRQN